jgi:hypothetical protein
LGLRALAAGFWKRFDSERDLGAAHNFRRGPDLGLGVCAFLRKNKDKFFTKTNKKNVYLLLLQLEYFNSASLRDFWILSF